MHMHYKDFQSTFLVYVSEDEHFTYLNILLSFVCHISRTRQAEFSSDRNWGPDDTPRNLLFAVVMSVKDEIHTHERSYSLL